MKKTIFLYVLACFCGLQNLIASHFAGAELYYQYIGNCTYRMFYTYYVDCTSFGPNNYLPPNMNTPMNPPFFNLVGVGCPMVYYTPQNWVLYSISDISNLCTGSFSSCYPNGNPLINGIMEVTYYKEVIFCADTCSVARIDYSNCCRSYQSTSGSGGESIYTELTVPLTLDNSSPHFVCPPIAYIPAGQTSVFQQTAFDIEGDSLVYSFAPCFSGQGVMVTYNPGYSPLSPLGSSWGCSINSQTGEVTFTPAPGNIVSGSLGIQVDEYRNGNYLGTIYRDMQVSVKNVNASVNAEPLIAISNINGAGFQNPPSVLRTSVGYPLSFQLTVTDPNAGQLLDYTSNIATQFPGATLTASGNTSPMILTFSWTPSLIDADTAYPLIINTFDDNCELNGHNYFVTMVQIDSAYLSANIIAANCTLPTGSIDISIFGGVSPYTYSWNTGDTTQDLINIPNGPYIVLITDANGNTWQPDTFYVNSIGLSASINATSPDCSMTNGALGADIIGGVAPFTYTWSNGMTGDSITNLGLGGYAVDIYDAMGCFYHTTTMLNYDPLDSCFSIISGILYFDENGNCVQDPLEVGIANRYIDLNPGGATFTDANGYYAFTVYDTGVYHLQTILSNDPGASSNCLLPNFTRDSYIPLLGIDSLHNDFPIIFQPDLEVYLTESWYLPGLNHYAYILSYNVSAYPMNAVLTYIHDTVVIAPVFTPPPATYNPLTYTATWNINNFTPASSFLVIMTGTTDINAVLGDTAKGSVSILPVANDATPFNNQDTDCMVVGLSYDPNAKTVSPQGQTQYGLISPNTETLEYVLHFQNTGNWQANTVIVKDTIDIAHLDITSTEIQIMSHACTINVENDSVLVFTFNNINLPDSTTNEPASHGFVKFGIQLKDSLPLYTTINNSSSIYFDFNAPILTNTTTNTLYNQMNLVITVDTAICPEDSVIAVVTQGRPPYQFYWSNGMQVPNNYVGLSRILANLPAGTHSVEVIDYYGLSTTQFFNINPIPLANATFNYTNIGNTYTFNPNFANNATYLWDFGNGQSSNTPSASTTYTQNGIYTITLIATDMCGGADTSTKTIMLSVANEPSFFQQQVNFSPNPSKDKIQLSFPNEKQEAYTLTIFDINGKAVKTVANIKANQVIISVNDLASGVYFWELKGEEIAGGKFIKE